jgi:hypothetical protein
MRKTIAVTLASLLTLTACTDGSGPSRGDLAARIDKVRKQATTGAVVFASSLRPVGDCDALLDHLRVEAAGRVGPYGLPGLGGPIAVMEANAGGTGTVNRSPAAAAPSTAGSSPSSKSTDSASSGTFSTTNNQEVGVDEPDIVKTDGTRIVTITANRLAVVPVDGGTPGTPRTVTLGGPTWSPTELLIAGDKALVFGTTWGDGQGDTPGPVAQGKVAADQEIDVVPTARATVTEVDLSGTRAPVIGRTLSVEGEYLTGRLVGSTARVVVRSTPDRLDFVTPQNPAGEERARKANEAVVLESTLEQWLPNFTLRDAAGAPVDTGLLAPCGNVDAPTQFAGFGSLSVLTFDLTKPLGKGDAVSVLAGGDTVYASAENLYVATQTWVDETDQTRLPRWNEDYATSIHQFSIAGTTKAAYVASGSVPGHVLNQFSMSEHNGVLRVATTKGVPWGATATSVSLLTTLKRSGDSLRQLGQIGDLGKGERIYAVRYAGDVAYLVTFRQTDPFYTVDLADPAAPKVLGELKITGYSGYLHPIDGDLVIGVGQEASAQGRVQGTKVSLFDVADLANPKELAKWTVPGGSSGAEFDHKAFLYWPATKTLVLPLTQWGAVTPLPAPLPAPGASSGSTGGSAGGSAGGTASSAPSIAPSASSVAGFFGAVVLRVDRAAGITELGRITHAIEKPADLGATDCRTVPVAAVVRGGTDAIGLPTDGLVLVCGSGAAGGARGYSCSRVATPDLGKLAPSTTITVPNGGWIEYCWPAWNQPNPILRSLVVGPALWTLSAARLQANALADLAPLGRVAL